MVEITQADIDRAKANMINQFNNPELLAEAHAIADKFSIPNIDGLNLVEAIRDLLIRQGEWNHEQEVKDHLHGMSIDGLGTALFAETREQDILDWLRAQIPASDFIFMPTSAMGKYKDRWNWIYFREKDQAMLFKLTWY